jgi:hypothetical protein
MMSEQIFIQVDSERVELTGEALDAFLEQRAIDQAEFAAMQVEQDAKAAAKESAKAKLAALGLTEVEILALVGE